MTSVYPDTLVEMQARDVRGVDLGGAPGAANGRAAVVMYERRSAGRARSTWTVPGGEDVDVPEVGTRPGARLRKLEGGTSLSDS